MPFITVVPAIRTIPGVEEFDYRVDENASVQVGDLIRVPFRRQLIPALVIRRSDVSAFADRAILISDTMPILRFDPSVIELLEKTAHRTFCSKPSVLLAWIRHVPKRATSVVPTNAGGPLRRDLSARGLARDDKRYSIDRLSDLIKAARTLQGRVLILTPWQHRADQLAKILNAHPLHADLSDGQAWKTITDFISDRSSTIVATRIGAWLASQADIVLIDEPENDDFKQDELAPRFDARWIVEQCSATVIRFSTTPRLDAPKSDWSNAPTIEFELHTEPWTRRGLSPIDGLSAATVTAIEEAIEEQKPVLIIHPIRGDQSRIRCRDCGWTAPCPACGFGLSLVGSSALCRRCGKRSDIPESCPSCGGTDFSRSRSGKDRVAAQIAKQFPNAHIRVVDLAEFQTQGITPKSLVVLTDLSLIAGAVEDIRRKERLVIAWRRLAASVAASNSSLIVHGPEELLTDCRDWLTTDGLVKTWTDELNERASFNYPPSAHLIKFIVTGPEGSADTLLEELSAFDVRGPFPVTFRSKSRGERFVVHLHAARDASVDGLMTLLDPYKKRAIIDLDPIAFFS